MGSVWWNYGNYHDNISKEIIIDKNLNVNIRCLFLHKLLSIIDTGYKGGSDMLSEKLKYLRKAKRLSQEDLAIRLCVVRQTISKWEKGFSVPDAEMLLKIAEVLDVSVNELLSGTVDTMEGKKVMKYDIIIIGAGPGGIFAAYELMQHKPDLRVAVFEAGHALNKRHCPIDGEKIKTCIGCKSCSIMSGFGGAGAFSDGKYNITNDFGGTLYEYIGKKQALDLMRYVDEINMRWRRY